MRYCQGLTRDTSRVFRVYIEFEGLCTVDKVLQWLLMEPVIRYHPSLLRHDDYPQLNKNRLQKSIPKEFARKDYKKKIPKFNVENFFIVRTNNFIVI